MTEQTIIVCNKSNEANELANLLKKTSIFHYVCVDESTSDDICKITQICLRYNFFNFTHFYSTALARQWQNHLPGQYQVLITTDYPLPDLKIDNAQNIIHYSLPRTWRQFSMRFASSFAYYDNSFNEETRKKSPRSIVMLDENNNEQLPRLIEFLQMHGTKNISEQVLQLANVS